MEHIKYYDLNLGQETVKLQLKYTLFKRVANILFGASREEKIDFDVMEKAFNLVVARNDCLRIRFKKIKGVMKQYFLEEDVFENIPRLKFTTQEAQEEWLAEVRKKPVDFMGNAVVEPYFIRTYDNRYMVFVKICHLIIDTYGLGVIFNDLFSVYDHLTKGAPMPEMPAQFEADIKKSNEQHLYEKNTENYADFFRHYIADRSEPMYAGIHGDNSKLWLKCKKKGKKSLQCSFFDNKTTSYEFTLSPDIVNRALVFCNENGVSLNSLFFYACALSCSLINHETSHMLPLMLSNCRPSALDKKYAGCKVQSLAAFTDIDYKDTFLGNLQNFSVNLLALYRRINFPDAEFEQMLHKIHKSSILTTYYSFCFSFVPYTKPADVTFEIFSNERGALPCYMVLLYDVNTNEIRVGYDVQDRITTKQDTISFQKKYAEVLSRVIDNPQTPLDELFK